MAIDDKIRDETLQHGICSPLEKNFRKTNKNN